MLLLHLVIYNLLEYWLTCLFSANRWFFLVLVSIFTFINFTIWNHAFIENGVFEVRNWSYVSIFFYHTFVILIV